ncbi:MAG: PAS domain S-box protein, partial [Deltaproteobacteria bacterium]|nr:PAS domain S-box protein [Deltaproteobacteria bacterium]
DITDRKKAEDTLRESEARFRLIYEHMAVGVAQVSLTFRIESVNAAFCRMLGYREEELLGKYLQDITHPESIEENLRQQTLLASGMIDNYHMEKKYIHKKGHTIYAIIDTILIRDGNDQPLYCLGTVMDISAHKRAEEALRRIEAGKIKEEALRESARRVTLLAEQSRTVTWEVNPEGLYIYVSDVSEAVWGYRPDELVGQRHFYDLHPEERREMFKAAAFKVFELKGDFTNLVNPIQARDGHLIWVSTNGIPMLNSNGELLGYCGSDTDISERKRVEEDLLDSEERFRLTFKASPDAVNINRLEDGLYVDINEGFTILTGYTRADVSGKTSLDISIWHNQDDRKKLVDRLKEHGYIENLEANFRRKNGSIGTALMSARVITLKGIPHIISITRDISDRKLAEEEKEKLQGKLVQAQKMEAIGTLAGGIAHDFNNILGAIMGYTQLAILESQKESPHKQYLEQIYQAGLRATDLVKHILSFSRQTEHQPVVVQVSSLIKEALKLIRASLPSTIEIRQHFTFIDSVVFADPTSIHQIVMNLCTNASHAMEEKGGILSVDLQEVIIDQDYLCGDFKLSPGSYVKLSVNDTGSGIKPEIMDRIFDPYFTTKDQEKGTGLGLAVIHGIVQSLKGAISVYSEPGKGTTFNVYLPIVEQITSTEVPTTEPFECGTERILFIDDEAVLADMGQRLLERLGYRVITKTSSLEALELFKAKPTDFDLVITDHTMPQMTGMELAKELLTVRPDIPIILCSGFSHQVSENNAVEIGIKKFIRKPLLVNTIAQAIREVLEQEDPQSFVPTGESGASGENPKRGLRQD